MRRSLFFAAFALVCLVSTNAAVAQGAVLSQVTSLELQIMAEAEEGAFLDTGYFFSLEDLNDLTDDDTVYYFDFINEGGGAKVIDPATGFFKPQRVDLLQSVSPWLGPYLNYQPEQVSVDGAGYDPGTPLDPWDRPYLLFSPLGLVRPPEMAITQEFYGDGFDLYTIVSLGEDGVRSDDDLSRPFGFPPTEVVISSVTPAVAKPGDVVGVKGYNLYSEDARSLFVGFSQITSIVSWESRELRFTVPAGVQSEELWVRVGEKESNKLRLEIELAASHWYLY